MENTGVGNPQEDDNENTEEIDQYQHKALN